MSPIIAGRFVLEGDAQRAVEGLWHQGFAHDDVTAFRIEPPADRTRRTSALGQPAVPQAAGRATRQPSHAIYARPMRGAGTFVAVRAEQYAKRVLAVNVLQAYGARDVERTDGTWIEGKWIDFDPSTPPRLVDPPMACEPWISRREHV